MFTWWRRLPDSTRVTASVFIWAVIGGLTAAALSHDTSMADLTSNPDVLAELKIFGAGSKWSAFKDNPDVPNLLATVVFSGVVGLLGHRLVYGDAATSTSLKNRTIPFAFAVGFCKMPILRAVLEVLNSFQ